MKNILFSPPDLTDVEIDEVIDTLKCGWITTGAKTKLFEQRIASFCGATKACCLNSATAALELTLRLLGIKEGDEVITSAYTYTASASVICHVGATPVMVDVAPNSYEMDYTKLAAAITKKTKAIIPVDIAGVLCNYQKIFQIVKQKQALFSPNNPLAKQIGRIAIVADAAHSFGATSNGKLSGTIADFTCFSFHAVKNLTTGEGGAVVFSDTTGIDCEAIYKEFMLLSLHGQSKDALAKTLLGSWEYDIISPAYKCNMTDIMASIGLGQLSRYPEMLARRHSIVKRYDEGFAGSIISPLAHTGKDFRSSAHLYMLNLFGKDIEFRNDTILKLAKLGIAANVHYKPLPLLTAYKSMGFEIDNFPNAYNVYKNELTLPLHTKLTDDEVDYIIRSVINLCSN